MPDGIEAEILPEILPERLAELRVAVLGAVRIGWRRGAVHFAHELLVLVHHRRDARDRLGEGEGEGEGDSSITDATREIAIRRVARARWSGEAHAPQNSGGGGRCEIARAHTPAGWWRRRPPRVERPCAADVGRVAAVGDGVGLAQEVDRRDARERLGGGGEPLGLGVVPG